MAKSKKEVEDTEATEAEASDEAEEGEEGEEEQGSEEKKISGKKLVLFYILPAVLAIAISAVLVLILFDNDMPDEDAIAEVGEAVVEGEVKQAVFYELPEMLVNLNSKGRKASYLKISVNLELENPEDIPRIEAVMPRIVDKFQIYLRELRIEDLSGSAGVYRLREELLRRVTAAAAPAKVKDILFKEMLIQ